MLLSEDFFSSFLGCDMVFIADLWVMASLIKNDDLTSGLLANNDEVVFLRWLMMIDCISWCRVSRLNLLLIDFLSLCWTSELFLSMLLSESERVCWWWLSWGLFYFFDVCSCMKISLLFWFVKMIQGNTWNHLSLFSFMKLLNFKDLENFKQ